MLPGHQYRSNSKLHIKEYCGKLGEETSEKKNRTNELIINKENTSLHTDVGHTGLFYTLLVNEVPICFVPVV